MISQSMQLEQQNQPEFNINKYGKHFEKLISKVKKQNDNLMEPVELLYLQNDLKIPLSIISESLDCSNGLICGYVNKHLQVKPDKRYKIKQLVDFSVGVLEEKIKGCSNITKYESDKIKQLIDKGRCILQGRQFKPAILKKPNNHNVYFSGGH
jgi:hypothetical protein